MSRLLSQIDVYIKALSRFCTVTSEHGNRCSIIHGLQQSPLKGTSLSDLLRHCVWRSSHRNADEIDEHNRRIVFVGRINIFDYFDRYQRGSSMFQTRWKSLYRFFFVCEHCLFENLIHVETMADRDDWSIKFCDWRTFEVDLLFSKRRTDRVFHFFSLEEIGELLRFDSVGILNMEPFLWMVSKVDFSYWFSWQVGCW